MSIYSAFVNASDYVNALVDTALQVNQTLSVKQPLLNEDKLDLLDAQYESISKYLDALNQTVEFTTSWRLGKSVFCFYGNYIVWCFT